MTNEEILQLIRLAQDSRVAELEVQRGDNRVRIRLGGAPGAVEYAVAAPAAPAAAPVAVPAAAIPAAVPAADAGLQMVTSPIVGTFYESPSPGAPSFVKVGDGITKGKVICIIESMKLMNEIECEYAGTVVSKLVENGQPVEYGQALYAIKPN
jgi:acetyl-CoA carboxylase biotin carboxyl carrier protein